MNIPHRLTGYDKQTELLGVSIPLSAAAAHLARAIARVPADDPDALGGYPLSADQVRHIADVLGRHVDTEKYDWFFEPAAAEAWHADAC